MRSFDRTMPEELNRVLTDHASDLLLCSTQTAIDNLAREGVRGEAHLVGDVMADVSLAFREIAAERSTIVADLGLEPGAYLAVTAHRAGNVDDPARLEALVALLEALPAARGVPGPPAYPRPARGGGPARPPGRLDARPAAGLPRLPRAGPQRARDPDRLGRRAEGGLPARRSVRDAARHHRVGRDRGRRLERAGGPRSRGRAGRAGAHARPPCAPSSTGAGMPPSESATPSRPTLRAYEDRGNRAWLCGSAVGRRVRRGGPRRGGRGRQRARDRVARRGALAHRGRAGRGAAGDLGALPPDAALRRPGEGRRGGRGGADAPDRQPRAGPPAADRHRHGAGQRAPGRPAGGARVHHVSGDHARALRSAARGVRASRPGATSTWPSRPSASTRAAPTTRCATRPRSSAG